MSKEIKYNLRGGLVTAPILYLKNVCRIKEPSIKLEKRVTIDTVGKALCQDFGNHSNCTLVGAYNLLTHYKTSGELKDIPEAPETLYSAVREVGDNYGYNYDKEKGIPVYNNRRFMKTLANRLMDKKVKVRAEYMVPAGRAVRLLDRGIPYILSIAYGIYYDHTVTVYGYETYRNMQTGRRYTFLIINDEWDAEERYLPWTNLDRFRITCLTRLSV